jgi:hypothetical protein
MTAAEIVLDEAYPEKSIEFIEGGRRIENINPVHPQYERLEKAGQFVTAHKR